MASPLARQHALLWGSLTSADASNEEGAWTLNVVCTISSASTTGAPGYRITEHLLRLGSRRLAFVAVEYAAATVEAREAGYR